MRHVGPLGVRGLDEESDEPEEEEGGPPGPPEALAVLPAPQRLIGGTLAPAAPAFLAGALLELALAAWDGAPAPAVLAS